MTERPSSAIWLSRLLIFKIILLTVMTSIAIYTIYTNPERGFLTGYTDAIFQNLDVGDPYINPGYATGYLLGRNGFLWILTLIQLLTFNSRKRIGFWITWTIDFITLLSTGGLPLFSIIILILGLSKSTRNFLKGK